MAVVTFTTDFGTADGYAGAMKGVVLRLAAQASVVDVTHDIPPRDIRAGALALATAARWFPAGTIHVAVVDPGVGGARAEVIVESRGQLFVGPDNGLLSLAAPPPRAAFRIENADFRLSPVSATFHGRDVFAAAAGRLALGRPARDAGPAMQTIVELPLPANAALTATGGQGEVISVDAFGNLITSFAGAAPDGVWEVAIGARTLHARAARTYAEVNAGEGVLYTGSGGRIEIGLRDGSAAAATGARAGDRVTLRRLG